MLWDPRVTAKLRRFWKISAMVTTVPRMLVGQISEAVREKAGVQPKLLADFEYTYGDDSYPCSGGVAGAGGNVCRASEGGDMDETDADSTKLQTSGYLTDKTNFEVWAQQLEVSVSGHGEHVVTDILKMATVIVPRPSPIFIGKESRCNSNGHDNNWQ